MNFFKYFWRFFGNFWNFFEKVFPPHRKNTGYAQAYVFLYFHTLRRIRDAHVIKENHNLAIPKYAKHHFEDFSWNNIISQLWNMKNIAIDFNLMQNAKGTFQCCLFNNVHIWNIGFIWIHEDGQIQLIFNISRGGFCWELRIYCQILHLTDVAISTNQDAP